MAVEISQPFRVFTDVDGEPLEDGFIHIGAVNQNPQVVPISVFFDVALTIPAPQPIRTLGGYPSRTGTPSRLYVAEAEYSISVSNKNSTLIYSSLDSDNPLAETGSPSNGAALIARGDQIVNSITELRALLKTSASKFAFVNGYYAAGDGGGGQYYFDAADTTSVDNGGTIIVATDGGRWKLVVIDAVTLEQFGAKGDGIADDTSFMQAARDYLAGFSGQPPKLIIRGNTVFKYSVSPNWAIDNLVVETNGTVIFRYTGIGNALIFDAGAVTGVAYNVDFGPVFIEAPGTSLHGVYCRSIHHSHIKAVVRGCGTASNALRVEFAVATTFDVVASVNENFRITGTPPSGWYLDAKPLHGIFLTRRGVGENTSACYFPVPIIEGVLDTGIIIDWALMNRFVGGTSEANTTNVVCEVNSSNNTFDGIDLEVASSAIGLIDKGDRNSFNEILNDALTQIQATAIGSRLTGGIFNGISDSGTGTKLLDVFYGSNGGVISELGTGQERMRCFNITGATFDDNKLNTLKIKLGATIKKHLSTTIGADFVAPAAVPGFTPSIAVTVTGAALGDTVVVSASIAVGVNYFLVGDVTAADTVTLKWGQLTGAAADPDGAGATYRIDVWGH